MVHTHRNGGTHDIEVLLLPSGLQGHGLYVSGESALRELPSDEVFQCLRNPFLKSRRNPSWPVWSSSGELVRNAWVRLCKGNATATFCMGIASPAVSSWTLTLSGLRKPAISNGSRSNSELNNGLSMENVKRSRLFDWFVVEKLNNLLLWIRGDCSLGIMEVTVYGNEEGE